MTRLVIVADNSLIVEAIRIGIRKSGEFNLLGHADGRRISARTLVAAEPDVILLDDMDQPGRTLELIRQIKAEDERIAVIVLSLEMDPDRLEQNFEAGAVGAISKATHAVVLGTLVRETLNGHICHRPAALPKPNGQASSPVVAQDSPLTGREIEILGLVAAGATNGDVARQLWVTEQTVKFHLRNIYRKLGVTNRTEASHYAHVNGLVSRDIQVKGPPKLSVAS